MYFGNAGLVMHSAVECNICQFKAHDSGIVPPVLLFICVGVYRAHTCVLRVAFLHSAIRARTAIYRRFWQYLTRMLLTFAMYWSVVYIAFHELPMSAL